MLSIISSGNRGCCSSIVPIREPPPGEGIYYGRYSNGMRPGFDAGRGKILFSAPVFRPTLPTRGDPSHQQLCPG
jgi:hypothetical protein